MQLALFDAVNGQTNHPGTVRAAERGGNAKSERVRDALATTEFDERVHTYTEA